MYAYQFNSSVDDTKFTLVEKPIPEPEPTEVRVRVKAVSLNYRDLIIADLASSGKIPSDRIAGSDAAGIIDALGTEVDSYQLGDRVVISYFLNWLQGSFRSQYMPSSLGGDATDGVFAEYIVVPASALVSIPDTLSFIEAATLPCAAVTAWHGLVIRAGLNNKDTIVIPGTGGVALFALQIANATGAKTIVLSSSEEKLQYAYKLGADIGINYKKFPQWEHEILAQTDGVGASIVLELGGANTIQQSLNSLAAGGRLVQVGVLTGFSAQPNMDRLQSLNADILGIVVGSKQHLAEVAEFYKQHKLHPIVDQVFPFKELNQAFAHLKGQGHIGKVVVQVENN